MSTANPSAHILVVDDQSDALDLMTRYVESIGIDVVQASDGLDAISCLYARRPVAVLLDMMMPRMDGLELITQIRSDRTLANIPIIAMSGMADMLVQATNAGANGVLQKPISKSALVKMVEALRSSL